LRVRDKILVSGVDALTAEERAKFSLFLATLLVGRPEIVKSQISPAQEGIENRLLNPLKHPIDEGKIDQSKILEMSEGLGSGIVLQAMLDSAKT